MGGDLPSAPERLDSVAPFCKPDTMNNRLPPAWSKHLKDPSGKRIPQPKTGQPKARPLSIARDALHARDDTWRRPETAFIGADAGAKRPPALALLRLRTDERHRGGKRADDRGEGRATKHGIGSLERSF